MRILVMESINALPDRVLLVQEARRRALTEPAASTFSLTKRRCCSWHDGVDVIAPCLPAAKTCHPDLNPDDPYACPCQRRRRSKFGRSRYGVVTAPIWL
jgi:hypothetical protein